MDVFGDVYFFDAVSFVRRPLGGILCEWRCALVVDLGAVDGFELFEEDADFAAVGRTSGVQKKRLGHVVRGGQGSC